jgi:hypothetical protein
MTERIYHHYEQLEEYKRGMWRIVRGEERRKYAEKAADLMRNPQAFKEAMRQAVAEWPISCEHNLSAVDTNRLAWLGHAGCCLAVGSSEENTRIGWHMLNPLEQSEANRVAQEVVAEWEQHHFRPAQFELFHA